jgi:hypothetical protein
MGSCTGVGGFCFWVPVLVEDRVTLVSKGLHDLLEAQCSGKTLRLPLGGVALFDSVFLLQLVVIERIDNFFL